MHALHDLLIPKTADSTTLSLFYNRKEKLTNPKRPTGITDNQNIRRFGDFILFYRKKIFGKL